MTESSGLEARIKTLEEGIINLTTIVSQQSEAGAKMSQALEDIRDRLTTFINKSDRPFPMSTLIMGIGMVITVAVLYTAPVLNKQNRYDEFHILVQSKLVELAREQGEQNRDIEWLKLMEQRAYAREK